MPIGTEYNTTAHTLGPRTTATSKAEGRLVVGNKKKRKILKRAINKR